MACVDRRAELGGGAVDALAGRQLDEVNPLGPEALGEAPHHVTRAWRRQLDGTREAQRRYQSVAGGRVALARRRGPAR